MAGGQRFRNNKVSGVIFAWGRAFFGSDAALSSFAFEKIA